MSRWHIEFSAGGDGCLPEHVDVYDDQIIAMEQYVKITSDHEWPLDDDRPMGSTVTISPCTDDRCDWCREAGAAVMPPIYSVMVGKDIYAFPLCAICAADSTILREIASESDSLIGPVAVEIEAVTHTRKETCYWCEQLVLLDPVGVDSTTTIPHGNVFDMVRG